MNHQCLLAAVHTFPVGEVWSVPQLLARADGWTPGPRLLKALRLLRQEQIIEWVSNSSPMYRRLK